MSNADFTTIEVTTAPAGRQRRRREPAPAPVRERSIRPATPAPVERHRWGRRGRRVGFDQAGLHGAQFASQQLTRLHSVMEGQREQKFGYLVGVTSAVYGEGKTTLVSQLGPLMAQHLNHRVLLVDCNINNPGLHRQLGIEAQPGYLDLLRDESPDLFPAFQTMGMENLLVLPAGNEPPPSPERFVRSAEMRNLLKEVRQSCDYALIDLPPVLPVADTTTLTEMLDAVVVVVRAGVTPRELVSEAVERIGPDRVLGTVLNGLEDHVPKVLRWLFMG